jgi:hypothetical protein
MNDIVERIRKLRFVHIPGTSDLMAEAADEIERLRLTDEERAAILTAADLLIGSKPGATLRSLLDRLHT